MKFKKGDKVVTPNNSHYNDKAYTVLDVCPHFGIRLKGARNSDGHFYFREHELEFWDIWKSPLWEALR